MALLGFLAKPLQQGYEDITGKTASNAAKKAAATQAQAAMYAADKQAESEALQIQAQQDALAQQQALMSPYEQFGQGFIGDAQTAAGNLGQLYNDPASIMSNPFFNALQDQAQTNIMQNAAVSGRLGTGGTQTHLQDAALRTGFDILNQERMAQGNYLSMMQGMVAGGQNAAAGMGTGQLQTGANIANTMQNSIMNQNNLTTGAAASQAAGYMGAANAQAAGTGNLINLGTAAFTGMGGFPSFGGGTQPTMGGGGTMQTSAVTNPFNFSF